MQHVCDRWLFVEVDELDAAVFVAGVDCAIGGVKRQTEGGGWKQVRM